MSAPFRFVNIEQGIPEWHRWRADGIGASEAAAILGCCPYSTADDVLRRKLGGPDTQDHPGMKRGRVLEPVARQLFEERTGILMSPVCVESVEHPIIRASLDGFDVDAIPGELKALEAEAHADVCAGIVPRHYFVQVQAQLLVLGSPFGYFGSYRPEAERPLGMVKVHADPALQATILRELLAFWKRVEAARAGVTVALDEPSRAVIVRAETVGHEAAALRIVDDASYRAGGEFLVAIAAKRKELQKLRDHLLEPVAEAKRRIDEFLAGPLQALSGAEAELRQQVTDYRTAREREAAAAKAAAIRAAEEKAAAERAAARRAAEEARAALAASNDNAEDRATASAVLARAEEVERVSSVVRPMVAPTPEPPKAAGISSRMQWSAEVVDLRALLQAALERPDLLAYVQANTQAINAHARAAKDAFAVPGCRVIATPTTAVRTAK